MESKTLQENVFKSTLFQGHEKLVLYGKQLTGLRKNTFEKILGNIVGKEENAGY